MGNNLCLVCQKELEFSQHLFCSQKCSGVNSAFKVSSETFEIEEELLGIFKNNNYLPTGTLTEIGIRYGKTRERIRQLANRVIPNITNLNKKGKQKLCRFCGSVVDRRTRLVFCSDKCQIKQREAVVPHCSGCGTTDNLYPHAKKDVKSWVCRKCNTERVTKYYHTKRGREVMNRNGRLSAKRHRTEYNARCILHYHVRKGDVVKPRSCEICGVWGEVVAHHKDYTKPLEVNWLCRECHRIEHRKKNLTTTNEYATMTI